MHKEISYHRNFLLDSSNHPSSWPKGKCVSFFFLYYNAICILLQYLCGVLSDAFREMHPTKSYLPLKSWRMEASPLGTSINDIPRFLAIFDLQLSTLSNSITSDLEGLFCTPTLLRTSLIDFPFNYPFIQNILQKLSPSPECKNLRMLCSVCL